MAKKSQKGRQPPPTTDAKLPPYTRGEMPVISDGQAGAENLERGPEKENPEGSVDISNRDYWKK